ncbi:flap structure-specific endonuclease [Candidatus Pacearchaeota archaeon]|nr:flap structure-specific endonuclease [Candidatus Pacearchaeota archaeon]
MGLQIGNIVPREATEFSQLKGRTIAVDAYNTIYQFLSTIRQPDGTPLMDKKGNITSHLSGLFYRNVALKYKTNLMRTEAKGEAREKYKEAMKKEDIEEMGKYAKQFVHLTKEIVDESKELLEAMGIAIVQAPGEAEAQAAHMARTDKNIYAVASQDYDSLLFAAPRLIQNLTLARRRKLASGSYVFISPEFVELEKVLNALQVNHEQLISIGILTGTDYNPGGVKGIGPKKALQIVIKYKYPAAIFNSVREQIEKQAEEGRDFDWQEVFELFKKPDVDKDFKVEFQKINENKIKEILLEHDFSEERIENQLAKLREHKEQAKQRKLF